jgi:FKBP-type peptidyl-prolyl cis-trans isomerase (trigger factor)
MDIVLNEEQAPPEITNNLLNFSFKKISSHLSQGIVEVDPSIVETIYKETITLYKKNINTAGLKELPISYIQRIYKDEIDAGLKNFIFYHLTLNYIINEILNQKISIAQYPRLTKMTILPDNKAQFNFDFSVADAIDIKEWKFFPFKTPKRKNYKDLDSQVASFLKKEQKIAKRHKPDVIEHSDIVCFEAILLNQEQKKEFETFQNELWIKINPKPVLQPISTFFVGKKVGDKFISNNLVLSDELEGNIISKHNFLIIIKNIVKGTGFRIEEFKSSFKLKNKTDVLKKIVEIFSYRNDISQRRTIIEEMFHLFFARHRFQIPKHMIIRRQEEILNSLKKRPDYRVYKNNANFINQVNELAEKMLKEETLIDQIANKEGIKAEQKHIRQYLSFFTNERLKEFVYFKPLNDLFDESSPPIPHNIMKHIARRERTLNHVLHHLTK